MTSPHSQPPADRDLWHHADFLRLWAAQVISAFGSRITRTALPIIAAVTLRQSEFVIGVLAAMQLVPGVILAMAAGGVVDRGRKRRILIAADLIRAALVASLTLAWAFDVLHVAHVIVVGAGVGAATALFQITDVAYLPALIGRRRLADGNAKLEATEAIAEITGPASGGVLIAALGAPLAVAIDAASYLWSAVMLGRIRGDEDLGEQPAQGEAPVLETDAPETAASEAPDLEAAASVMRTGTDFRIGVRTVFGHAQVRPLVASLMVWSISGGFFVALYAPFCLRELGLSTGTFGVIIAMGGVGSLAGAVLGRSLARLLGVGRTLIVTSMLSLSCTLFIPIAASGSSRAMTIGFLIAHQLLGDGFAVAFIVLAVTLRQTVLPREVLGRANAAIYVSTTAVLVVAAVLAGALASLIGIRTAVWAGLSIGLLAPIFLWPLRHLREMPAGNLGTGDAATASGEPRDTA